MPPDRVHPATATKSTVAPTPAQRERFTTTCHPLMMFAVETYCPATDGVSAARIEEEVIVTPRGAQIITLFPAQELPIANRY